MRQRWSLVLPTKASITPIDLPQFLKAQEIRPQQWDLLVFGDGSGGAWPGAGGFCAFMVDARRQLRAQIIGGHSNSTVNRMELGAYVEALNLHYNHILSGEIDNPPYRVWIFSDSEYVVKSGNREQGRKANRDLWVVMEWYETRGYRFKWRWVPRNSTPLNAMSDRLAGRARVSAKEFALTNDELYTLMPAVAAPDVKPVQVNISLCAKCQAPLAITEKVCPQCGLIQ